MKFAVTGASGQLGRAVVQALHAQVAPAGVRLASRTPAGLADFASMGYEIVAADFDAPASLRAAFDGVDVALLISGDAPIEQRTRQHRAAIDAAKDAAVRRVVYTSFTNPTANSRFPFAAIHADTEAYLRASGLRYTILRNNHYADNIGGALAAAKAGGALSLPGARGKVAFITRADAGAAAAGALLSDMHADRTYEVTGPRALNLDDIAALLGAAWQRRVEVEEMAAEAFAALLRSRGVPEFAVQAVVGLRAAVAAGEYAQVSDDAARLIGRPAQSMRDYLAML